MRTVRDEQGRTLLCLKRSDEASLVRVPETGEELYVPNDALDPVEGESPLETVARAIPSPVRRVCRAARTDAALGLVVELDERGPLAARTLLDATDRCESDLHGMLAELLIAGVVEESTVAGERGYALTEVGHEGLAALRN